jgi:hypothetical protein
VAGNRPYDAPENLSLAGVAREAKDFLGEFWPDGKVPVDIEDIAEFEAGIGIVLEPGMYRAVGVDACLLGDRQIIVMDAALSADALVFRYRLTLATQVGHWYLHESLYKGATHRDAEGYLAFRRGMSLGDRNTFDWQARTFAELVLVPPVPLRGTVAEAVERAQARKVPGFDPRMEPHRGYVAGWVGRRFEVEGEVILRRGADDNLWPP